MSDKIKVGIKVRPLIAREKDSEEHWIVVNDGLQQVEPVSMKPRGDPYIFDHVFTPDSTNREVFEILVKPIVQSAVHGFNGTIFAYGQTSSGKTYTMMGDKYEPGIIPLAVDYMFKEIENSRGREYLLRVAYMEIYNERINDLLKKGQVNLKVSEDSFGNVVVKDLTENIVNTPQMCMDFMKKGEQIRKIGETNMNDRSSRSHTIFRVIIESREVGGDAEDVVQVSHLNLVDLAGSERAGSTGAVGERLKEGCAINKSLFMLSHVISKLSDGEQFVNFRDSRLTRILQSSLGGNALTAIICAVTPASSEETLSTLGFASRARNIKNTAQVNEVVSDAALLKRYARQINKLKSELEEAKQGKNGPCVQEMESKLQEQEERNRQLQERLDFLTEKLIVSSGTGSDKANEQRMKTLRRRTWTAPSSLRKGRSSLQALTSPSSFLSVPEEPFNWSSWSTKSSPSGEFGMPLEEFEKDLLRRCPSPVLLDEEEENEEPFRLDSRFISTRRGRSSVRSSYSDCESRPMEENERERLEKDKVAGQRFVDHEVRNVNILTEDCERLKEEHERKGFDYERATIVSLEETVQNQAGQIESSKAENEELVTQINSLKAENKEFVTQMGILKDENEKLVSQMKIVKAENEDFMTQMKTLKAENEEFVSILKGSKTDDTEFVGRVESIKAENQEFLTQINILKAENEELAARIRSEKVDEEAKISSLEDVLRNQAEQIRTLVAENEDFVLRLKSNKEDAEAEISSLRKTVTSLENELEASRSLKNGSSVVGEETPKTKLRREFTEELNELKDFTRLEKQTYNEELESAVERLRKELDDREEAESELKSKLNLLTQRCSDLERIKEEFDVVRRDNLTEVDLKVLLMDSNKTIAQLTDANKELQSEVEEAKKQLKNAEILQVELETLRRDLAEVTHLYQESERAHKSQLARMKDLEEERGAFDLKMDVIKKQFVRREKELTNSLEEAWDKLKAYESGDGGNEARLREEVEKLKAENAKFANQINADQEERIKQQLADVEDGAVLRKEIERLEAENAKYTSQIDVDQEERIKELSETVRSLERQLSIFRNSDVTRKGRLSALYVLEEEPSIGELSDEVYGLRTENRQYKLRISDLEDQRDEYQQQIATLRQQLEDVRSAVKFDTVKYSNKAVDVSEDNVSYSECDVTIQRGDSERAALLAEVEELQRISNMKTEENFELRAALERMSKEVAKHEETAELLNKSFINESNLAEALNRSFNDESNSAEAEEYVTCTDDTLATTSKSSCSVLSLEKMNPEEVEALAAEERTAKPQSVYENRGELRSEISPKSVEDKRCDEVKDVCIKRKHESVKDVPGSSFKDEYEGDVLDDISIPTSCDVSFIDETATPDFKAKKRRMSRKFAASPRYQQDSPIKEVSSFDELKEVNSCLEAELDSKNERIAVLMEEISDVRNQLGGLQCVEKERKRLQQVLEDKNKHIADVEAEVLELRANQADAEKLREDLAILESNIQSKNEVIQELEAKIAMIEEELRRQGTEVGVSSIKLQEELCELESTLSVKSERIASMEKEMAQLESEVTNLRLVANDATRLREDLAMSKSSCESKEGVIGCLEKEINLLREELARSQDDLSSRNDFVVKTSDLTQEEASAMQEEMASLQEKLISLSNVQREKDLLEEKIAGLQEELSNTNAVIEQREQLVDEVASLKEKIAATDALTTERDQLVGEVDILQEKIATMEALTKERDRLVQEVITLQKEIATVEAVKEERDRLLEEVATLQEKIVSVEAVKEERDLLLEEVATLKEKIASVEALKEEGDRLVEEVSTPLKEIATVEAVIKERDRLVEEVTTLQEKVSTVEALKEDRDRLLEKVATLQEEIATVEAVKEEKDRLVQEVATLQEEIATVQALKEERDRFLEKVATLQKEIATVEAVKEERDRLLEEVATLQEKIVSVEAVKDERDLLLEEVATLKENIATVEAVKEEKDRLVQEVATLQEEIATVQALKEERDRLLEKVATLHKEIATVEAVKEERDRLVEEVTTLQEKIALAEAVEKEKDRLVDEVTVLRERITTSDALVEERDRLVCQVTILQEKIATVEALKEERDRLLEEVTILRERIATTVALAEERDQSFSEVALLREKIATVEALKEERDRLVSEVAIRQEKFATLEAFKEERDRLVDEIATLQERMVNFEVLKEEKARLLEEVMELRLNSPNPSKSHDDILLLKEENDSKMRRTILLERENALLKERLSLSGKSPDELGRDFDADQWEDQVISVRREIISLQENVALDVLKQEKERLQEKLAKESARAAQIEADFEKSCSNLEKLKEDNRSKAEKIKELEEEIARISASQVVPSNSEEISRLHEQLQLKIEKIAVIEVQLAEARDSCLEISKLREDLASMEKENSSKEDRVRCLEGELASLRERFVGVQEDPKDQSESKEISSLQEEVLTLRHKISFLSSVNEENERLEKEVEESVTLISNLRAELSELRAVSFDKRSLKEEVEEVKDTVEEVKDEVEEVKEVASLEKECRVENDLIDRWEAELVRFKMELARSDAFASNVEKQLLSKLRKDVEAKQEEIVSFDAEEKECLQRALDEKIEEITRLRSELAELKIIAMNKANLKEDSAEWQQGELKCAQEDLCLKESELKSMKEDLSQKESELKSTKEDLWQKESELKSAKEGLWQKESELKSIQEDLCQKERELKSVKEDFSLKENELASVKDDLWLKDSELKSVQVDLCMKENELKSVQEDLSLKESELTSVKEDLSLKESELTSVKVDLSLKESELTSVKEDLRLKESELTSVKEDLRLKARELTSVKEDILQKESKLKSVREDLCLKEDELESLKSGAVSMESSYKVLKEELNEKERRIFELESEVKALEEKSSTVVLLVEEKRRLGEELVWVRGEKERLQEELQLKTERVARFEVEVTELQVKAADAVKLQDELERELDLKKDELAAKADELESLKIEINRLSPFENLSKALKYELNESKKKVAELESELAETKEKVADYTAGKQEKDRLVKELETKSKELEDQVIMVKFLEERAQSKKADFDSERVQLKKTMTAQIEKYAKENETLKGEVQNARKFIKEQIESADPEKICSDIDDIEELVVCLIAAIKKSKSKHFVELKEKYKTYLTELTVKLKRSEASEKEVRQRLEEAESTLKKYKDEIRRIGDLDKTLTAMSDRTNKFESDLETARSAEAVCLRRLQQLSCVADGCVDTCLRRIEELLLAKADQRNEPFKETHGRSIVAKMGCDKHVQTDRDVITNQNDGKMSKETCILELRRLKIELSEKEETNSKLSTKVAELTSRCEECAIKISSLERLLSDAEERRAEIVPEAQIKSLLSKLSAKESRIEELQQQLRDERSKSWLRSPMRGSYSAAEDEYKQRVELLSKELKQQTQLAESLAGSLEEQRRLYSESVSKAVVAAERKETARLKEECEQLKEQLSTVTKAAEALQSEKRVLATQLTDSRLKLEAANNTLDGRSLTDTVDLLSNAEAVLLKQQVKTLQEDLNRKNAEIEELKEKVKDLDWECEQVASELRKTRSREEKLYAEVEESEKTIKILQQVEQDLKKALTEKQHELDAALTELEERRGKEKPKISPKKYQDEIRRIGDLEKALTAMSDRTNKFESDLETARSAEAVCLRRLQQLSCVADGCVDTCLRRIEELLLAKTDQRSEDTVDSLSNAEAVLLKQQVKTLQEDLNTKNAEIEELKERVKDLDCECEEVATELRKTRSREEKFYAEVEENEKTIKMLQQVEQDLKKALTEKQHELDAALTEPEERRGKEKPKISPLLPKGQLWHTTDLYRPSTSAQDAISSHLLSKIALSENVPEGCQCDSMRQQVKALRTDLSDAKGRNVELEMELKRQNYPFKKKIEVLESEIKYLKNANSELRADNRRLQNTYADTTIQDCEVCRMRLQNRTSVEVQTEAVRDLWLSGRTSGIVEEVNRVMLEDRVRKLQKENGMLVTLCKARLKKIEDYEEQLKRDAK